MKSKCMPVLRRSAFTLVELLVVITIIGILIMLLLPAIQAAREAARQAQCLNNLKQLALGALNYEFTMKTLPPGIMSWPGQDLIHPGTTQPGASLGSNWLISVLPFIEQQALYDSFNFKAPISDTSNSTPRGTSLGMFLCPSDRRNNQVTPCEWNGGNWARGNYGANGAQAWGTATAWNRPFVKGVMGANLACAVEDIKDGTSNTIMLLELRAGVSSKDRRGTWAMGVCGASSFFQHASWGLSPDWCTGNTGVADAAVECAILADPSTGPGAQALIKDCMPCSSPGSTNLHSGAANPRSCHQGGVNMALCDGSVRFLSEFVENGHFSGSAATAPASQILTWQRLNLSNDGLVVDATKF